MIIPISYADKINTLSEREILGIATMCYSNAPIEKFLDKQEEKSLMQSGLVDIQVLRNFLILK